MNYCSTWFYLFGNGNWYLATFCDNLQNQSDQSSSSDVMKKGESNKKPRCGLSPESDLVESIMYSGMAHVPMMEHFVVGSDNANTVTPKISLEEQAKNRGDAMLRYKQKKKTRRYSASLCSLVFCFL